MSTLRSKSKKSVDIELNFCVDLFNFDLNNSTLKKGQTLKNKKNPNFLWKLVKKIKHFQNFHKIFWVLLRFLQKGYKNAQIILFLKNSFKKSSNGNPDYNLVWLYKPVVSNQGAAGRYLLGALELF